jgi:hypothetical protein
MVAQWCDLPDMKLNMVPSIEGVPSEGPISAAWMLVAMTARVESRKVDLMVMGISLGIVNIRESGISQFGLC